MRTVFQRKDIAHVPDAVNIQNSSQMICARIVNAKKVMIKGDKNMKKVLVILLLICSCVSLFACGNSNGNNINGSSNGTNANHQHNWSQPYCGTKQKCLTCGEEENDVVEHNFSEPICEQNQICLICGKSQSISHDWSDPVCEEKQICLRCNEESKTAISHTSDDGYCTRCGTYYTSKEKLIEEENARYESRKTELYDAYVAEYERLEKRAEGYYKNITHSESYVGSQLAYLDNQISITIKNIASLSGSIGGSALSQKKAYEQKLENLQAERNEYAREQMYWGFFNDCLDEIEALNNKYEQDIAKEEQIHQNNLKNINNQ